MLRTDAVPTIFENLPTYLSTKLLPERKERQQHKVEESFNDFDKECTSDKINLARPIFEKLQTGTLLYPLFYFEQINIIDYLIRWLFSNIQRRFMVFLQYNVAFIGWCYSTGECSHRQLFIFD